MEVLDPMVEGLLSSGGEKSEEVIEYEISGHEEEGRVFIGFVCPECDHRWVESGDSARDIFDRVSQSLCPKKCLISSVLANSIMDENDMPDGLTAEAFEEALALGIARMEPGLMESAPPRSWLVGFQHAIPFHGGMVL